MQLATWGTYRFKADITDLSIIPDWCPLKPLPEKSTAENDMTDYQCGMVDGWNQCIDEITGGMD